MQSQTFSYRAGRWTTQPDASLDSRSTLVVCFAAARFADDPTPLRALRATLPQSHIIGCSTSGEIHGGAISDDTIVVAVARFAHTRVASAVARVSAGESRQAGEQLGKHLDAPDLRSVIVLSDGLAVNGSDLARGINDVVRDGVSVTGGLAGDGDRFQRTFVIDQDGSPLPGAVCAAALYGDQVRVGHGSKGGWDVFGPQRRVTRAKGNVLYELDGRPALELYKRYLGERAAGLPATALLFPLALQRRENEPAVVRTVLSVDEEAQSMTFAGDIEEGGLAQLMRANFDRLVQGASDAAVLTASSDPVLTLAISCVGRRLVLGERAEEETEATLHALPQGSSQVGYYSYGEISPYVAGGRCDLHNQTMTLTTLRELMA